MSTPGFSPRTNSFFRAAVVSIAPAVALFGHAYHPWLGTPADGDFFQRLATAVAGDPTRWWVSHLLIAVGSGFLALAFLAIRSHLRDAGEERWSVLGLPFVVFGSTLYALLPAIEFAPLGATRAGADAAAVQAALMPWFASILLASAVIFALGVFGFAVAIVRSKVLSKTLTWMAIAALGVLALTRFFHVGAAQLYVGPAAGAVGLWPLAYVIWTQKIDPTTTV